MKNAFLLVPFFLALVVIGLGLSGAGSVIPEIAEHFAIPYALGGRVFFFHGLGYFVVLILGGILGDFVFRGTLLRLGFILATFGFLGITLGYSFSFLLFAFLLVGVGIGFVDCMVNPVAQGIFKERPGAVLNTIHAFFGLGSLLAPRVYAVLRAHGHTFRELYGTITLLTGCVAALFFFPFIPRTPPEASKRAVSLAFREKVFWFLGCTMLLYAAGVSTLNGWLVTYFKEYGLSEAKGALFLSYFWFGLLSGRFALALLSERLGYLTMMRCNALGGVLGTGLCIVSGVHPLWVPLSLFASGFLLSTLVPLTITYALVTFPEVASTASGWVLFNNGLGTFLFPWLFGFVGGKLGFRAVLAFVPLALFGVFLFQHLLIVSGKRNVQEKGAIACAGGRTGSTT